MFTTISRPSRRAETGFSLIELLVVIGIIGVLISILLPGLSAARERSRQLKCLAVLHEISQAAEMHVLTHHGYLPAAGHHWDLVGDQLDPKGLEDEQARRYTYYNDNGTQRPMPITAALAMEMGLNIRTDSRENLEIDLKRDDLIARFTCPSQVEPMLGLSQIGPGWISPKEYSSYIFNEALMGRREFRAGRTNPILGNVARVRHSAGVFLAADGRPRAGTPGEVIVIPNATDHETLSSFVELTSWGPEAARGHLDYLRHRYRMNIVFLDGHAETIYMTDSALEGVGVSQGIYDSVSRFDAMEPTMRITSIRRWQWIIIGLLVGASCGLVREWAVNFNDELASLHARRIGQRDFEQALVKQFRGKPHFTDIVISRYRLSGSGPSAINVDVVAGLYWDGRTRVENGQTVARWEPAYFVASIPYRATSRATTQSTELIRGQEFPNVMAYLQSPQAGGATFQYSSWWWVTKPQFVWTAASVAFIGGVWPTVVNLLAFGTFRRPREEKGISLRNVKSNEPPVVTQKDESAKTAAVIAAIEADLLDGAATAPTDLEPVSPPASIIKTLPGEAQPVTAPIINDPKKDFGAEKEDFYPTELHGKQ